ncbi:hypothetical protein [Mesorhizobium sp. YM1C-6-2]|uniref:hypothetical protein n=1 Tax=Mesorhizobium sp. YM1C-6-2 TaxID=1827501 RepID=UPI000EF1C450|nr:hypothetical protein [Mesorhizobium sp. YM1C-6-2]RLP22254.1 hypothetical protein D8676_25275 [Mesorhizobium sp. YM1C-6-2]
MTEKSKSPGKGRKAGRPEYQPKIEDRQTVEEMRYCGESETVIARALGIDPDTLRKHFVEELANGHANRRKEVIGLMFKSARDGNASNQKRLEEIGRAVGADESVKGRGKTKEPPVGKKEAKQKAAEQVGGKFAPPEPPRLVVNNK